MKRIIWIAASMFAAQVSYIHATSVTFSAAPTARQVVDASSAFVTDASSLVLIGTFANQSFSLNNTLSLSANFSAISASGGWHQFGLDTVTNTVNTDVSSSLVVTSASRIGGSVTDNNFGATQADFFNSKPLYLWIFNANTVGAATQMGIFRATSASTPWVFPTNTGFGDSGTFSSTSAGAPTISAIGGVGSASSTLLTLTNNFSVAPVPEASTATFGLLTGLVAICARRRRSLIPTFL